MNFDPLSVAQFAEKYWYKRSGLVVALAFIGILVGWILATASANWPIVVGVLAASWVGVFGVWCLSRRVPRTKKNKIGFVISIHCYDDRDSHKILEDFVIPLRHLLRSAKLRHDFHFTEFTQHLAGQIHDHADAEKLRAKARAHFMLYGRVRERILDGKEHHIIELDGIVSHKSVANTTQQALEIEFTELLPRRINISRENDLLSFKFTSEWAGVVSEYIIAIAAYISGDLDYAEELYNSASRRLESQDPAFPIFAKLVERIPFRISEIYESRAHISFNEWLRSHDKKYISEIENHIGKIVPERQDETNILFLRAFHAFVKDRDTQQALRHLKKIRRAARGSVNSNLGGAWNYNMAFLHAYDGNLSVAIRHYRQAATAIVEPAIITQVEDFLYWVLEQEPEKYQLYYCLGFFNWKTKGDGSRAGKDFGKFLAALREGEFEKEKELAERWVGEIYSDEQEAS